MSEVSTTMTPEASSPRTIVRVKMNLENGSNITVVVTDGDVLFRLDNGEFVAATYLTPEEAGDLAQSLLRACNWITYPEVAELLDARDVSGAAGAFLESLEAGR